MIFVFGSNLLGIHGAGAALHARDTYGAKMGVGEGPTGYAYALPTCSAPGEPLPLEQVRVHVARFLDYAREHHLDQFQVTRVGCGYAGFTDDQIAPMFFHAPDNVWLPSAFARAMVGHWAKPVL